MERSVSVPDGTGMCGRACLPRSESQLTDDVEPRSKCHRIASMDVFPQLSIAVTTDENFMTDRPRKRYRPNVGMVIFNADGLVLSCHRRGADDAGRYWQFPQGGIHSGESTVAAVFREMREEVGLKPGAVKLVHESRLWRHYDWAAANRKHWDGQSQKWFLFELRGDGLRDIAFDTHPEEVEFDACRWRAFDDAVATCARLRAHVYASVREEFGPMIAARLACAGLGYGGGM